MGSASNMAVLHSSVLCIFILVSSVFSERQMLFLNPHEKQDYPRKNFHNPLSHSDMEFPLSPGNEIVPEISSDNNGGSYQFHGGDSSSDPLNNMSLEPPSVDCGYEVDGTMVTNGTIISPGFPDNYPEYLNCKWSIKATPGKKILASFSEFDVTASTDCSSDYVVIITGPSAEGGTSSKYCGKAVPSQIESIGEVLEIEFHSNQGDSCRGFSMDFSIVTKIVSCGDTSSDAQFEFISPMYPQAIANKTDQCDLKISHDCESPICQLRLDLLDFILGPPQSGDCNLDQFIVRANEPLPVLCGNNSGQHLYVDVRGRSETNLNLLTMPLFPKPVGVHNETDQSRVIIEWLHEVDFERRWKVMVTQIPCDCADSSLPDTEAPTGCLQYHTGISGQVSSFNFHGTIRNYEPCWNGTEPMCGENIWTGHLNNQDYSVCIKTEPGYCGVAYSQTGPQAFQLTGLEETNIPTPWNGENMCTEDYLYIPRGQHPQDLSMKYTVERYCGQVLGNQLASPVLSYSKPFLMRTKTDTVENQGGVALNNRGFELQYNQIPCSLDRANAASFA